MRHTMSHRMGTYLRTLLTVFLLAVSTYSYAHSPTPPPEGQIRGYMVRAVVIDGDTIPTSTLPTLYVFKPIHFNNAQERVAYSRLVRDVKRTLPYAKMVAATLVETYEYLETLPTERERVRHLKRMEKELYKQYKPELKELTLTQGKLLLKLITRETNSSSYHLIDAFLGGFTASFWNFFAGLFGTTLKTEYDPEGADAAIERVVLQVERGQI